MTHSYECHDLFIRVTWRLHTCDMTHSGHCWPQQSQKHCVHQCCRTGTYLRRRTPVGVCGCVCMCACMCACVCVCLCVYCIHQCCRTGTFLRRRTLVCVCVRDLTLPNVYDWMATLTHVSALWNESCHLYEWVMSIIWTRHSHVRMSNVKYVNESCHTCAWVMSNIGTKYMSQMCEFICGTWLIIICDMTHYYVWHDSFICVTRFIHMLHICMSDVQYIHESCHTYAWVMSHIWKSHFKDMIANFEMPLCALLYTYTHTHTHCARASTSFCC